MAKPPRETFKRIFFPPLIRERDRRRRSSLDAHNIHLTGPIWYLFLSIYFLLVFRIDGLCNEKRRLVGIPHLHHYVSSCLEMGFVSLGAN